MGDVLMTTPALRAIRQSLAEDAHLALLTSPSGAAVARRIPEVDEVVVHRAPWMKAAAEAGDAEGLPALARRLGRGGFDAAVIFTTFSQSPLPAAMACHLAGIPRVLAHVRENPYALVSDWVRDPEWPAPARHEVRRQLDLVAAAGCTTADEHLSYRVDPGASRAVRALLGSLGIGPGSPFVVVHPGATAASRRYRPDGFEEAAAVLASRDGLRVLVTGTVGEATLVERIARAVPGAVGLAGRLGIDKLGALIAIAPLLVSNNTGPAHLAAAVGTPVVVLYAQTNLQHTPWAVPSRVLTRDVPCHDCLRSVCPLGHHACLAPVEPAEIVAAARELLGTSVGVPPSRAEVLLEG
ncbi:MAG: glycosyltransferase family 9 protein [Chloroflexi bacterium]|nr:glycosyltransferase family 9 protein [Chloroflexota bacterium]